MKVDKYEIFKQCEFLNGALGSVYICQLTSNAMSAVEMQTVVDYSWVPNRGGVGINAGKEEAGQSGGVGVENSSKLNNQGGGGGVENSWKFNSGGRWVGGGNFIWYVKI